MKKPEQPYRQCHMSYGYHFCKCKQGVCESYKNLVRDEKRKRITRKFWKTIDKIKELCQI